MLKSLFYWLDFHSSTYWAGGWAAAAVLLCWVGLRVWKDSSTPAAPARAGWVDAAVLLLFLLAWRWPFLFIADDLNPDESQMIAGAMKLTEDPVFWRSVDGTTSGPLNYYVLLPLHWFGLRLDYFSARLTGVLLIAGALFCCLRALASTHGRAAAWLGILPAAAFFATVTHSDLLHYSSEHLSLLLIALPACLLAIRQPDERVRLRTALFLAGAAPWAKLQVGPIALVLMGWGAWQILHLPANNLKVRLGRLAGGALIALAPTLLVAALTAATGQFEHMVRRYFLHNLLYMQGTMHTIPTAVKEMTRRSMEDGRFPLLLGAGVVLLLLAGGYLLFKRVRPSALLVVGFILTVASVLAVVLPRREFLHYVLLLPVPFTLLLGAALGRWWSEIRGRGFRVLLAGLALGIGLLAPLVTRSRQLVPSIYGSFLYDWQHPRSKISILVNALAGREGHLGIWGWANHVYVETGLIQATRDTHSTWSIVDTPQRDYHRAVYLDDLRRSEPTVFIDAVGPGAFAFEHRLGNTHEDFPALAEYISEHYVLVRDLKEARVYVRKGSPALENLSSLRMETLLAHGRDRHRTYQPLPPPITPLEQLTRKDIGAKSVMMMLPPTTVEWKLDDDVREVTLEFGFDPEAYERGDSNGAEVRVELAGFLSRRTIYRRLLDPKRQPDDRGPQIARIVLPPFSPGTHLALSTGPGEHNNNAWDWVYLATMQFRRSPRFLPDQFPGFNRVPDRADAEASVHDGEGPDRYLQMHAPASITYLLDGTERRLAFDYGFRPGAYTDGGLTDGAIYRVELQQPGQPHRVLFKRLLNPLQVPADRGTQQLALALPEGTAGLQLVITIDPGPAGSAAWDWTYLRNLTLK